MAQSGFAQMTYRQVDSTTYQQYVHAQWKDLARTVEDAKEQGFNYYYLNLRLGIAYYYSGDYSKSAKALNDALENNSTSSIARQYLFWSYWMQGDERLAHDMYTSLPDSVQRKIYYHPKHIMDQLSLIGGIKISNQPDTAGNITYGGISLQHKFAPGLKLEHGYMYSKQTQVWGHFTQHDYYATMRYALRNGITLGSGLHLVQYESMLDFEGGRIIHVSQKVPGPGGPAMRESTIFRSYEYKGDFKEQGAYGELNVEWKRNGMIIRPHAGGYRTYTYPAYTERHTDSIHVVLHQGMMVLNDFVELQGDTTKHTKRFKTDVWQAGVSGFLELGDRSDWWIGADINYLYLSGESHLNIAPSVSGKLTSHLYGELFYIHKGYYPLALLGGQQLLNAYDGLDRVGFSAQWKANDHLSLRAGYQHESVFDILSERHYQLEHFFFQTLIRF